jgi:hypothetical protein
MLKQNTTHKATQIIKGTLHTMNTKQKRKTTLVKGRGGPQSFEMLGKPQFPGKRLTDGS